MTVVLLALAAGVGGVLRYAVDIGLSRLRILQVSLATPIINTAGSFALGFVSALAAAAATAGEPAWLLITGTGFLGGFTTMSTASVDAARLFEAHRYRAGVLYAAGMLIAALLAAGLGFLAGAALGR